MIKGQLAPEDMNAGYHHLSRMHNKGTTMLTAPCMAEPAIALSYAHALCGTARSALALKRSSRQLATVRVFSANICQHSDNVAPRGGHYHRERDPLIPFFSFAAAARGRPLANLCWSWLC